MVFGEFGRPVGALTTGPGPFASQIVSRCFTYVQETTARAKLRCPTASIRILEILKVQTAKWWIKSRNCRVTGLW